MIKPGSDGGLPERISQSLEFTKSQSLVAGCCSYHGDKKKLWFQAI